MATTFKKTCKTCKVAYPVSLEYFYRKLHGKYGLTAHCKACERANCLSRYYVSISSPQPEEKQPREAILEWEQEWKEYNQENNQ